jgi:hypothetical protein
MKITSSMIKAYLRIHFQAPRYALLEEVRNATGKLRKRGGPRYADAVAMSLWPSDGLELLGFEIKLTRADWLKELSDDKKAVAVQKYCDRWYLVVPEDTKDKIVKDGELPANWGLMTAGHSGIKVVVQAPKLKAENVTRDFMASLLRNAVTSNKDYVDVQAKIVIEQMAKMPAPKTKSNIKIFKRKTMNSMAHEIKSLKKEIADIKIAAHSA